MRSDGRVILEEIRLGSGAVRKMLTKDIEMRKIPAKVVLRILVDEQRFRLIFYPIWMFLTEWCNFGASGRTHEQNVYLTEWKRFAKTKKHSGIFTMIMLQWVHDTLFSWPKNESQS